MPQPSAAPRRGRFFRIVAALAVLLALAGYVLVQYISGGSSGPRCTAQAGNGSSYRLSPEQAVNAATISAVGTSRGMPERAVTIALATAIQESELHNLDHGDRDSLGLFQQRPSQGWGTAAQVMDPVYAAGKFYQHLGKIPGYSRLPLTVAAQEVQRSGFPQAYAKHEPDAELLAAALTGRAPASFSCAATKSSVAGDPAAVRAALKRDFGGGVLPAGKPAQPSAPSEVRLPVSTTTARAVGGPGAGSVQERGWELAYWAVANSAALHIQQVSYAGQEWTAATSHAPWRRTETTQAVSTGRSAGQGAAEVRITLTK
ncbi:MULTISPECIES: heavy metal transporter [unclassified Streptomyces]|uniref:heavy metal transporter n=1 Tax=unclassified Streptomyces TaxID=2593676 RepID=UPI002E22E51E|nr:heavy metal transporter [Streptomyces sp. NBC_01023]